MKKIFYSIFSVSLLLSSVMAFTSCDDFFDPDTDDELNGEDYISSNTEMYTGFLGIMTKMQAVGDKEIILTDTRADILEPTDDSTPELIALYNYDGNLQNNPYADPAGYYEVIIACNDYLVKMKDYRKNPDVDDDIWQNLVSSTVRIKVWAYKTLAEIYGKAVWFDSPITKVTEITEAEGFEYLELEPLIDKCIALMDNGFEGVPTNRTIDWIAWLDPSNVTNISGSQYRKWNWMIVPYEGLYAELNLWKGACIDRRMGENALQTTESYAVYKKAADALLSILTAYADLKYPGAPSSDPGSNTYWLPSAATPGHYKPIWDNSQPYQLEAVAALIYDYTLNQTNTLLKHFSNEYPNKYWLRPSEYGMEHFIDPAFNPGSSTNEARYKIMFGNNKGQSYISKFRPVGSSYRVNAYQDDCHIYIYRSMQYHMLLAEALNHLGRFKAMNGVFNSGVKKEIFDANDPEWEGFSRNWTSEAEWGNRKYASAGLRGCFGLKDRAVKMDKQEIGEYATFKFNDLAILDESMLEFACEGKVYPIMNRMAVRYGDNSIVADRVCPKYEAVGKAGEIRGKIMAGGNWVPFDLKVSLGQNTGTDDNTGNNADNE
ncbi:MAG: hypothetical protein J6B91_07735 [Prevotella sp.]|nr:hypothetical protein [Prevotella sp.]